jgi:FkbM family methyltransferase
MTAATEASAFPSAAHLRLPNGMTVVPQSRVEAEHFYEDLFEKRIYLRHGITLEPGDCVFDVGGNIGMFSLFVHRHAPGARVYTFEPAPPLYHRLLANLALNGAEARTFNFGIAEAERTARFTFYPNSSGMSSFYADDGEERMVLRAMIDRQHKEGMAGIDALMEYTDELLEERFRAVEMECRLRPLSAVLREQGVDRIDLLKIDVQKAELDVLRGLDDADWPRIRQIAMEVHDLDGRLEEVTRVLESRGFRVAVEQDEAVEGSILYNLFAVSLHMPPRPRAQWPAAHACAVTEPLGGEWGCSPAGLPPSWHLLPLSAPTAAALDAATAELARHLARGPGPSLGEVAFTLRVEGRDLAHRRVVLVRDGEDATALLLARDPARSAEGVVGGSPGSAVFLFPGVGEQYPGMSRGLYGTEPVFRAEVDRCAAILQPHLGLDLREVLFAEELSPSSAPSPRGMDLRRLVRGAVDAGSGARLSRTEVAQPVAFVVGYALARLWESRGVHPDALLGHSLGEYTAACLAGVFGLEDALTLVALRARAIQALPGGAMLAVPLSPDALEPWLDGTVALAAVNAPELCVLSGSEEAIARAERSLAAAGHVVRRLATTHAFHSMLMEPVAEQVAALTSGIRLEAPRIPLVSNVTGTWLTAAEATDPRYWARHLVGTVRFSAGVAELLAEPGRVMVEMGPGGSLGAFVRQQAAASGARVPAGVASLPHPADDTPEPAFLLGALGRLWTAGVRLDWTPREHEGRPGLVPLPSAVLGSGAETGDSKPPEGSGGGADPAADALGEVETALAGIWHELLSVRPAPGDDFFLLGGHSLVATRLIAQVRDRFGVEMRLRTLFQTRTLAGMARWIEEAMAHQGSSRG